MMRIQLLKNNNYTNQYYLVISLNDNPTSNMCYYQLPN